MTYFIKHVTYHAKTFHSLWEEVIDGNFPWFWQLTLERYMMCDEVIFGGIVLEKKTLSFQINEY